MEEREDGLSVIFVVTLICSVIIFFVSDYFISLNHLTVECDTLGGIVVVKKYCIDPNAFLIPPD